MSPERYFLSFKASSPDVKLKILTLLIILECRPQVQVPLKKRAIAVH